MFPLDYLTPGLVRWVEDTEHRAKMSLIFIVTTDNSSVSGNGLEIYLISSLWSLLDAVMMQMEDDEIEAEAADEQEDSSGPRKRV